jgi:hypothetical protein
MTDREAMWAARVAGWRASGQTSTAYSEGKPFTAGGLRHWAHRLGHRRPRKAVEGAIRIRRVVGASKPAAAALVASAAEPEPLMVEIGVARIAVRPGVDRPTLTAVLEVLVAAARSAR